MRKSFSRALWLSAFFVLAMVGAPLVGLQPVPAALADDGGGDGGDGGGGGGGGGGDPGGGGGGGDGGPSDGWRPYGGKSSRAAVRCRCQFLVFGCKCSRGRSAKRPSKSRARALAAAPASTPSPRRTSANRELVVAGLTGEQQAELDRLGFRWLGQFNSGLLDGPVVRLRLPSNLSPQRGLQRVQAIAPTALAARNDLYSRNRVRSYRTAGESCGSRCPHFELTAWTSAAGRCTARATIGIIDTGVDLEHPSLADARVEVRVTRSADRPASDTDHGTGVLSLLAGAEGSEVEGLSRGARFLAADAFHRSGAGNSADAFDLLASLDWLHSQGADIVNMSLSGPDNPLLQRAVEQITSRGVVVVAAAGLPDERASLGYPGRYEPVVAVSAVDLRLRPSRLSARGEHLDFAAPGVGLVVARSKNALQRVDGTSFAAPFVAAAFALAKQGQKPGQDASQLLTGSAKDLGAPGRDPVFGWGVVQFSGLPGC